jgi:hypothetical protein
MGAVIIPSYSHLSNIIHNNRVYAVLEPGTWYCNRCDNSVNDPQKLDKFGRCDKCAEQTCPDCSGEIVEDSRCVFPGNRIDPPEYERRLLCPSCGWEERE